MDKRTWPAGIRPSGRGLRIRIWRGSKPVHSETIKGDAQSPRTLAAAIKRRDWLNARVKLGLPIHERDVAPNNTVSKVAQDYLNSMQAKISTKRSYVRTLNLYWIAPLGDWPINEVTTAKIKEVLSGLTRIPRSKTQKELPPLSAKTKINILGVLRLVFQHAGVSPNPANFRIPKAQKKKVQRYTPEQRAALLGALSGQDRVYFALLFGCGLRPCGEPLALKWSDYDGEYLNISEQLTARKRQAYTKTSVVRKVYVPKWVRAMLKEHYTRFKGGPIFQTKKGMQLPDTDELNAAWKAAHIECGIPYSVPYTCRHTRAAELISTEVNPAEAAVQMGHSISMFLDTYAEFIEDYAKKQNKDRFEGLNVFLPTKAPTRS